MDLPPKVHDFDTQARDKGVSSWLTALPLREQGFDLNKEQFRDALSLRYNIPLEGLPSTYACGDTFNVPHALSCKKGGFITMRHDNIRDILTFFLCKVCKDVQSEPHLIPLENEVLHLNTANRSEEARLDIKANAGQWILATWPNILRYQSYRCEHHIKQKQEHQGNLQKSRTCQETRIHGTCVGSRMGDFHAFGNGNKWRNGGGVQSVLKPTSKQTGSQTK